ncbi:TPA: MarR family transcriptional regulator, partial [Escherichia coli]|nr:MarR family transcriptional regulator [Escherichia coli]HBV0232335.1 MarR family transcriptional regulator [Escherichia coli]
AELRRLWRSGSVIRKERKTGGRFSYQINPMPFGCGNPLTNMFNQLLKEARA